MRAERDNEAGTAAAMGSELARARAAEEAASAAAHEAVVSECRVKEYAVEAWPCINTMHCVSAWHFMPFVPVATGVIPLDTSKILMYQLERYTCKAVCSPEIT
jgi:hypothetical protein